MEMSELGRLAQPLIDRPLVAAPAKEHLRERTRARHRRHLVGSGASVAVIVAVVALVVTLVPSPMPGPPSVALASFIQKGVSVPDSVLQSVGLPSTVNRPPSRLSGYQPPLGDGHKVAVVYVGAEYCPYCALERWALIVALSRFGSFNHLGQIVTSSTTDVDPGLKSWSFLGSAFVGHSVSFHPAEIYSSIPTHQANAYGYEPLQHLTPLQKAAFDTYDNQAHDGGALPFIDIGNRYILVGASADPGVLQGLSLDQIAADLSQRSSPVAQAVDSAANYLIAALCAVTDSPRPAICSASFVGPAQARMAGTPATNVSK
jgi:hypothetical protein